LSLRLNKSEAIAVGALSNADIDKVKLPKMKNLVVNNSWVENQCPAPIVQAYIHQRRKTK